MNEKKLNKPINLFTQVLYTLISIVCIALFYDTGVYKEWYENRAKRNFNLFLEQRSSELTEEQRKEEGWGSGYIVCNFVANYFDTQKIKDPLVLLEPNEYIRQTLGFKLPEPVVFYYFTQGKVKAVWMNSNNVGQAKYMLRLRKEGISIQPIKNAQELAGIINEYKSYKQEL